MLRVICLQGGSASLVGKTLSHLTATGKIKPGDRIIIQLFDQDSSNKDTIKTKKLLESLNKLSNPNKDASRGEVEVDLKSNSNFDGKLTEEKYFFNTPIEFRNYSIPEAFARVCRECEIPAGENLSLKECFLLSDDSPRIEKHLMDTLFTEAQQKLPTDDGFEGSAARGALLYLFLLKHDKEIFKPIQECVDNKEHCQVIICGSIFGGTGASFFKATGEALRKISPTLIHTAGVLIFPTFKFVMPEKTTDGRDFPINPSSFWPKTMTSLRGYAEATDLVKKGPNDTEGIFDRIYIAAQPNNEMHNCTKSVDKGGQKQERANDFADLVAAYYIADFLNSDFDHTTMSFAKENGGNLTNIYTLVYPDVSVEKKLTLDCFNDKNDTAKRFSAMLTFCAFAGLLKYDVAHCNKKPDEVEAINKLIQFTPGGIFGAFNSSWKNDMRKSVTTAFNKIVSDTLIDYLFNFVECVKELSENGMKHQDEIEDYSDRYALFNKENVAYLYEFMGNVKEGREVAKDDLNRIQSIAEFCPNVTGCSAASVFFNAVQGFDKINDSGKLEDLFKAYLNHCYKYITDNIK